MATAAPKLSSVIARPDQGFAPTPGGAPGPKAPAGNGALAGYLGSSPAVSPSSPTQQPVSMPSIQPNGAYDQSYQNALAASRAGIAAQVRNALAETNRSDAAAHAELGTVMPTINNITGAAQRGLSSIANASDQTQKDNGFRSFQTGASQVAPSLGAESQLAGFQAGAVPLISAGIADRTAARQAAVQQYQMEQNNQLNMAAAQQAAQHSQALEIAKLQMAHDQSMAQWNRTNQLADENTQHQWGVQDATTAAQRQASLYRTLYGPDSQTNPASGLTNAETTHIQQSPAYKRYETALGAGTTTPSMVYRYLQTANPHLLQALAASNPSLANLLVGKTSPTNEAGDAENKAIPLEGGSTLGDLWNNSGGYVWNHRNAAYGQAGRR